MNETNKTIKIMKTIEIYGEKFNYDNVIDFKQSETGLFECFFFKGDKIVISQYLSLSELNKIKND